MIREYQPQDQDDLLNVWWNASLIAHPFLSEEFLTSEKTIIVELYLPNTETWVYTVDDKVVGFIALMGNEVGAIFVDPAHQQAGFGRQLMDKAVERRGELEVEVFAANSIGQAFYSRYGFEPIDEKIHEPTGQQVLRLRFQP